MDVVDVLDKIDKLVLDNEHVTTWDLLTIKPRWSKNERSAMIKHGFEQEGWLSGTVC